MTAQAGLAMNPALPTEALRESCLQAGADDVGFVSIADSALGEEGQEILLRFPFAKTLISLVFRLNRENVRTPLRSIANLEFHQTTEYANEVARDIVKHLESLGHKAVNPAAGFPMEMAAWPGRMWAVSHKTVAVAAGTGRMGINRLVLHPVHGAFITLGTVVTDALIERSGIALETNPCLDCKLCVAACPTGAISPDGAFDFNACYTHNYREFMGGFLDWTETVASSGSARKLRAKISDAESVSMWQSLAFGPNYKAAYCMSVCPAGDDVIGAYRANRAGFMNEVVKPLTERWRRSTSSRAPMPNGTPPSGSPTSAGRSSPILCARHRSRASCLVSPGPSSAGHRRASTRSSISISGGRSASRPPSPSKMAG